MLHYTLAEFTDEDDFETAEMYYSGAMHAERDQPVAAYQLTSLYMRQGVLGDALGAAEMAIRMCANKADGRALSESRLLAARIHDSLGNHDQALAGYEVAVSLGNATALDLVAAHYAGMGTREGLDIWYQRYTQFAQLQDKTPEATFAEAILRQPTYSEWHTNFVAAATVNHPSIIPKAYRQAIRQCRSQNDSLLVQAGCRFHLAEAYSKRPHQRSRAIPLWTWTLNYLTRFKSSWENADQSSGTQNRLFTLTIEQLSVSQALTLNHPLIVFTENIDIAVFDYSRIMIMLGKGIERQNHLRDDAATLYRRVLKRAVKMARQSGLQTHQTRLVLGDCLMALQDFPDAARSLSWACNFRDPVAPKPAPTADQQGKGEASIFSTQPAAAQQSLDSRISWYILCDSCMAKRSWNTNIEIFGYRYKCCVCSELDLCEPCYEAWKGLDSSNSGAAHVPADQLPSGGALRQCSADHNFMKLPSPDWPDIESETRMIIDGDMPKSVPAWLDELADKFDLDLQK
jgi:hypothetical protein